METAAPKLAKKNRRLSQMFDEETAEARTRRLSQMERDMKAQGLEPRKVLQVDTNLRGESAPSPAAASPTTTTSTKSGKRRSFFSCFCSQAVNETGGESAPSPVAVTPTTGVSTKSGSSSPKTPLADMASPTSVSGKVKRKLSQRASAARIKCSQRFHDQQKASQSRYWQLVIATALASASLSFAIDLFTFRLGDLRSTLTTLASSENLLFVTVCNITAVCFARIVVRQCIEAEGSGFPDMKAMIFGKVMPNYLTGKVLAIKALALGLVVGAGMPAGKEGPNVHMAACLSRIIAPKYFTDNLEEGTSRGRAAVNSILLAACAVGVAASFSSPIGGVIFTVEFMLPQLFDRDTYWGCFVATVIGSLTYAFWRSALAGGGSFQELISTDVKAGIGATATWPVTRSLLDVALGAVCGLLAGLWIKMHTKANAWLKAWRTKKPASAPAAQPLLNLGPDGQPKRKPWMSGCQCQWRDLFICASIVTLNTVWAASLPLLSGKPQPKIISDLFNSKLLEQDVWRFGPLELGPVTTMIICATMKWITTILTLAMAMPTGVVAPTMIIGGLIGRCFVMVLISESFRDLILGTSLDDANRGSLVDMCNALNIPEIAGDVLKCRNLIHASFMARFGIVGAAAFCAGVCRCFAMAITIFECTALPSSVLPLCFSSLTAIFIANRVALPFFDMNLVGRGLGGIPYLSSTDQALRPVVDVMKRVDLTKDVITRNVTPQTVRQILSSSSRKNFAVVEFVPNTSDALLCANITRESLEVFACLRPSAAWSINVEDKLDLLSPHYQSAKNDLPPLVDGCPTNVDSSLTVKDVYISLKITNPKEHLYVTNKNRLLGYLDFADLLVQKV